MSYRLAGHKLSAPLISAAGLMNGTNLDDIMAKFDRALDTKLGGITLGSITIPPIAGNEAVYGPPVYHYDKLARKTYNSFGLANIGKSKALKLLPNLTRRAHDKGKVLIYSVSRCIVDGYGEAVDQALELTSDFLAAGADLVEINLSTPNSVTKDGGRAPIMGHDPQTMKELLDGLAKLGDVSRVGLKLPPYTGRRQRGLVPEIAGLIAAKKIGFITTCNTIGNQIARDGRGRPILSVPGGLGGLSGPATQPTGRRQLELWAGQRAGQLDIISCEGLSSGQDLVWRLRRGAAAGAVVTYLHESRDWSETVDKFLNQAGL